FDHASMAEYAHSPTLALPQLRLVQRLAFPPGTDAHALSPLHADDLSGLAPALVVVPTQDALADHGRRYAEQLGEAGTPVRLSEYPGAKHAFLTLPGVEPQAEASRRRPRPGPADSGAPPPVPTARAGSVAAGCAAG
ncbi:alpha/beta hydrolase fold domain-containing protein, partial [Streptomyces lydicus]|uniref:alpha/beta hydrolase fold domain-containing protein n=1 Tax=Streptomyces lydicus TaxID=47763 RepID=UPI0037A99294